MITDAAYRELREALYQDQSPSECFGTEEFTPEFARVDTILRRHTVRVSATTQRLIDLLIERDQAGLAKYGTTLDRTDLSHTEWLQHMTEEALDAAGYAQAAIRTYQEQSK